MNNYIYKFEFFSSFYAATFYRQTTAVDERHAIIQILMFFKDYDARQAEDHLVEKLGDDWTSQRFWNEMDLYFSDDSEGYELEWIKRIDFDLEQVGEFV